MPCTVAHEALLMFKYNYEPIPIRVKFLGLVAT